MVAIASNGTFYIKFKRINFRLINCLAAKNLLMNVTKTNKYSNVTTFVHALIIVIY